MGTDGMTTVEVADRTGVPYYTLSHWLRGGLVRASVRHQPHQGGRHLFSSDDVTLVGILHAMNPERVPSGSYGAAAVRRLVSRVFYQRPATPFLMVIGGQAAVPVADDAEILAWANVAGVPCITLIKVAEIRAEVTA